MVVYFIIKKCFLKMLRRNHIIIYIYIYTITMIKILITIPNCMFIRRRVFRLKKKNRKQKYLFLYYIFLRSSRIVIMKIDRSQYISHIIYYKNISAQKPVTTFLNLIYTIVYHVIDRSVGPTV